MIPNPYFELRYDKLSKSVMSQYFVLMLLCYTYLYYVKRSHFFVDYNWYLCKHWIDQMDLINLKCISNLDVRILNRVLYGILQSILLTNGIFFLDFLSIFLHYVIVLKTARTVFLIWNPLFGIKYIDCVMCGCLVGGGGAGRHSNFVNFINFLTIIVV